MKNWLFEWPPLSQIFQSQNLILIRSSGFESKILFLSNKRFSILEIIVIFQKFYEFI